MLTVTPIEPHGAFEHEVVKAAKGLRHHDITMFSHLFNEEVKRVKWRHYVPNKARYQILLFDDHIEMWKADQYNVRERMVLKVNQ